MIKPYRLSPVAFFKVSWIWTVLVLASVPIGEASTLSRTNFEHGEKIPWERFVTPNGTIGGDGWPIVTPFDMLKDGQESQSLKFQVGQVQYDPENAADQGGGVLVQITTEIGRLDLSAHIAVTYHSPKDKRNLAGGRFEWVVDDHVIASHDMGPIENGKVLRHHFEGRYRVKAGPHTIRLRITRPFISHPEQHTPFQYADDLLIRFSPNR